MSPAARMADEPVSAMITVSGKRFACERCGANVFTSTGENFACNGCGTEYGSRARTLPLARPRVYSFTRDQLIGALRNRKPPAPLDGPVTILEGDAAFEAMADAIIEALEEKPEPVHYRWPVVCAGQIPGTKWTGNLDRVTCAACCAITAERLENERRG